MRQKPTIADAIAGLTVRAERQQYTDYLLSTFVDAGAVGRLDNSNNQIIYGRRGAGKTHLLRVLARRMDSRPNALAAYIDLSGLGDTRAADASENEWDSARVVDLFRDILLRVHRSLVEYATRPGSTIGNANLQTLDSLEETIRGAILQPKTVSISDQDVESVDKQRGVGLKLGPSPSVGGRLGRTTSKSSDSRVEIGATLLDHIPFVNLREAMDRSLDGLGLRTMFLLLDEWPSIRWEVQPVLAEFVRRCFFGNARMTVKIASIEYRSNFFSALSHNVVLGFELGADIGHAGELDDLFVFDRNNEKAAANFSEIFYRHVAAELALRAFEQDATASGTATERDAAREIPQIVGSASEHLQEHYGLANERELVHSLFASTRVFRELVRAAEGVVRDFISIAAAAHAHAVDRGLSKIDMAAVRHAARDWFEQDKATHLSEEQREALKHIVEATVGSKRSRTFLLEKEQEGNDVLRALFDRRVIHLVSRGFIDRENVGTRYNIYALDYGTYVTLLNTDRKPQGDFTKGDPAAVDLIVPFGDRRTIQRLVLNPADFAFVTE